jgi:ABC-type bacteriocin/lantibiotic exporter with double-glycine peptidase domain
MKEGTEPINRWLRTLAQLSSMTGQQFDQQRVRIAIQNAFRHHEEPLEQLIEAAAEVAMAVTPARMPLRKAIWQARSEAPVVAWSPVEERWIVISHAGWFKARIADGDHPWHRSSVSRLDLARRLGLKSAEDELEVGLVQPERPAEPMRAESDSPFGILDKAEHVHVSPVRRFLALLKGEKSNLWLLLLFSVMSGILLLATPLAVDAVVSNLAFGGQQAPYIQALLILSAALLIALAVGALVQGFQYYIADIIQRRLFVRIAADLGYRLPRVRASSLDGIHAPELVNRFLDIATVQKSTALLLLDGVNVVFGGIIGMILLGLFHPYLLGFAAVLAAMLILIVFVLGRGAVGTAIDESLVKYRLVHWFEQVAQFPMLFKGPGGYELAMDRTNQLATDYINARRVHFSIVLRQIGGLLSLQVLASASLLAIGGYLVLSQQLTLGQLVASELIVAGLAGNLVKLGKKLEAWYDTMAATDKLGHVVDLQIEREDGETHSPESKGASVSAKGVSFGNRWGTSLIKGLSFDVAPGAKAAVVGPHGSGVSSVLDMIFGLRRPDDGYVAVDDIDLRSWYLESLRKSVQLIRPDEIVTGTLIDNLRLGHSDIGLDEIRNALTKTGLLQDVMAMPDGMNTMLQLGGLPLSAAQRARLLLARAFVQRPRLLLVDEVLDGLDDTTFKELRAVLFGEDTSWTLIVATREADLIESCGQLIQLAPCHLAAPHETPAS